jgi:hypothetical protein
MAAVGGPDGVDVTPTPKEGGRWPIDHLRRLAGRSGGLATSFAEMDD